MEVKIGVQDAAREIILDSAETAQAVEDKVSAALSSGTGVLTLVDDKGRRVFVAAAKIAYVEIGETAERRVGFGAL